MVWLAILRQLVPKLHRLLQHRLCEFGLASEDDATKVGLLRHLALPVPIGEVVLKYWISQDLLKMVSDPQLRP